MLLLLWLLLCLAGISVSLLPLVLRRREMYKKYSSIRLVACPENQMPAAVGIDARHAAATAIDGSPHLRLCECSRWPERAQCNQACLPQAIHAGSEEPGEAKAATRQIYHLPIFLAAFVAWVLGAIWHSQWLFRTRWINDIGLTRAQVKQIGWLYSPHLLTAAICLLFAYGVASLLAVSHRKGVLSGVLASVLLGAAVSAACWLGIAKLPHDLLILEAGYAILATLTMGAIVGGLYNKLVVSSQ